VKASAVKSIAQECGFELAGIAPAVALDDYARYQAWVAEGMAGEMRYLTDHRGDMRRDARSLLPSAKSVICVGRLYHAPGVAPMEPGQGIISRYAWGQDYHDTMRAGLVKLAARLAEKEDFEYKICVDTAPLLERSYARQAGLGWIGKNTCLINEPRGSWFLLGEIITSLALEPDAPPPDRCGTCTRCIDACPTDALTDGKLDARRCISYFTIELRGSIPVEHRAAMGAHIFGCDICQDVCPWNSSAPVTADPQFQTRFAPDLETLANLNEGEFRAMFRDSPMARPKHAGMLRNVAIAMGNTGIERFRAPLDPRTRAWAARTAAPWATRCLRIDAARSRACGRDRRYRAPDAGAGTPARRCRRKL
jgi:epoxyqueuosine reductase